MQEFQIGDYVEVTANYIMRNRRIGERGFVCDFSKSGWVGINFDNPVGQHTCHGHCEMMHGYYVDPAYVIFADENNNDAPMEVDVNALIGAL